MAGSLGYYGTKEHQVVLYGKEADEYDDTREQVANLKEIVDNAILEDNSQLRRARRELEKEVERLKSELEKAQGRIADLEESIGTLVDQNIDRKELGL